MQTRSRDDTTGILVLGGAVVGVALLASIAAWAGTMKVASAAIAPGVVVAEGNRKPVQHPDGGPIRAVLVREGERVSEGQPLIELDLAEVRAEYEVLNARSHQLEAQRARLRAERDGIEIAFPPVLLAVAESDPQVQAFLDQEVALLEARRRAIGGNIALFRQAIEGSKDQISGLTAQLAATRRQLDSVIDERDAIAPLVEEGIIARNQSLALDRTSAALEAEIETVQNRIAGERSGIGEAELQIEQLTKALQQEVSQKISDVEAELSNALPRVVSAEQRLSRGVIVSPQDGYVYELAVFSKGATILPGQVALEIVPVDEPLVLSVEINPADIDRVKAGQGATIHLLAYQQRSQAIITGQLEQVSADLVEEQTGDRKYYTGVVSVDADDLARADAELIPGMPVQAMINTGSRTIAAYVLDPILRISDFALRED